MYLKSVLCVLIGLCSGVGVAAGTFAFFLVIRVIPRMVQKAQLSDRILSVENMVVKGVLFGTVLSFFTWKKRFLFAILGKTLLTIYGMSAGIFAGCIAVALAEILDVFPILFRRLHLPERYCEPLLLVMAVGKILGSLFFFPDRICYNSFIITECCNKCGIREMGKRKWLFRLQDRV